MADRRPMDTDDAPVGRILTRREILALLGASGAAAALAACAAPTATVTPAPTAATAAPTAAATAAAPPATTAGAVAALPSCIVRPELTEGPYFVDEKLERTDIRSEPSTGAVKPGALLALRFNVSRVTGGSCSPLAGATVDVWHCDSLGVYSDVSDPGFNTRGQRFLRGYQVTDQSGAAEFTTIYPGWYQGRAVHIHFKIRVPTASGQVEDFTSQLFFVENKTDDVYRQAPYSQKSGSYLRNAADGIYRNGGDKLLIDPVRTADGYAATFDIGLT